MMTVSILTIWLAGAGLAFLWFVITVIRYVHHRGHLRDWAYRTGDWLAVRGFDQGTLLILCIVLAILILNITVWGLCLKH